MESSIFSEFKQRHDKLKKELYEIQIPDDCLKGESTTQNKNDFKMRLHKQYKTELQEIKNLCEAKNQQDITINHEPIKLYAITYKCDNFTCYLRGTYTSIEEAIEKLKEFNTRDTPKDISCCVVHQLTERALYQAFIDLNLSI